MLPAYSPLPWTYRGIGIIRSKLKCKGAAEAAKHPTTTTTTSANIASFAPPRHCQKKQNPTAPPNNDKWLDNQTQPLKFFYHPRNAQLQNRLPLQPSPWPVS
jgi:hypothetical protein